MLAIFQAAPGSTLAWVMIVWTMVFFSLMFIDIMLVAIVVQLAKILKAVKSRKS